MTRRSGFTLVELVVVILILGILAGVAAPKMFNKSKDAAESSLKQNLAVVRDAIELYSSQNGGNLPTVGASDSGASFKALLAPYIRGPFPACPVGATNASVGQGTGGSATPTAGWIYNNATGAFMCGSNAVSPISGVAFDLY